MGNSLQEQLLKAGLVSSQKSRETRAEKRKTAKQERHGGAVHADGAKADVQRAQAEKAARDRELNLKRQEEAAHRALAAEVEQLIEPHRIPREGGDVSYHFADGKLLKKILVTRPLQQRLAGGSVAIVRFRGGYELVTRETAERVRQRDPAALVLMNDSAPGRGENDEYAEHPIPDDLMW